MVNGLERIVLIALLKHLKTMGEYRPDLASFEQDTRMGIQNLSMLFSTLIFDKNLAVSPDSSQTTTGNSFFSFLKKLSRSSRDSSSPSPSPVLRVVLVLTD